jgi:GNAT superfamily N-acetyltransferase
MQEPVSIRFITPDDDLVALTAMIHAAYSERASVNLLYWATHQSVEDTARRLQSGQGFVAETARRIVGTVTVRPPNPDSEVALYRRDDTWTLSQFGVHPRFQRTGIGRRLHDAAVDYVRTRGGRIMALDTAAPATNLIDMYGRWGYSIVGEVDWRPQTNYVSVVMSRPI